MAESTLSLALADFRKEAALALSYNRDYDSLTTNEQEDVDRVVETGYRQFLWPPPVTDPSSGRPYVHNWTFLRVIYGTMQTTASDYTDDLPDTFGHIEGDEITIDDDAEGYPHITRRGEAQIRAWRQQDSTTTGVPRHFAIRPKAFDGSAGQRFEILWHPPPDDAYDVTFPYSPLPNAMVISTTPYPWGGAAHAETIKTSIWAAAEHEHEHVFDGPHQKKFLERLQSSIAIDLEQEPSNLGQNSDTSDGVRRVMPRHTNAVTYTPP